MAEAIEALPPPPRPSSLAASFSRPAINGARWAASPLLLPYSPPSPSASHR
ncbi:hypothetical protein DAI22_05g117200 [Oryza sativa Japonica Group]|nr:hypothetical protein DAI22_05g117200 [Oryza sativa Japonica Group]